MKRLIYAMTILFVPGLACQQRKSLKEVPLASNAEMILPENVLDTALPNGRKIIYLVGRKNQPGFFAERSIFPPGYIAKPHVHNIDLYITILKGSCYLVLDKVVRYNN